MLKSATAVCVFIFVLGATPAMAQVDTPAEQDDAPTSTQGTPTPARSAAATPTAPGDGARGDRPAVGQEGNENRHLIVTPRVGLALPSGLTPTEISSTLVGPGLAMQVDATALVHRFFEVGVYAHYSMRPILKRGSGSNDGQFAHVASFGGAAKVRIPLSQSVRLRFGPYVGVNLAVQDFGNAQGTAGTIVGYGFNIGPDLELAVDVAKNVALNFQFAFLAGPGKATLPPAIANLVRNGADQTLTFYPLAFVTVGLDFYAL